MPRVKSSAPRLGRLLPVAVGSLLGLLAGGALLQHAQQQSAAANRQQLTEAWVAGPLGALQQGLQRLAQDFSLAGHGILVDLGTALVGEDGPRPY